ncbi:hypothetical protein [Paenibacillus sp. Leaf72]|uniref:hypothetical protein n=1 Tax=Paenibacillus sp. Leaf72 TaxID=1736234 RepID=UPI0006F5FC0F|nr:hypothetical protein [Paenibacillus sp. Leaf72]KQO18144.1 hypothetical protein ASF12_05760 [Paenibacillus sp. Leaf72]
MSNLQEAELSSHHEPLRRRKRSNRAFFVFVIVWIILISGGIMGAKWYSDKIQRDVAADLERQTSAQIAAMQQDYTQRMDKLEASYKEELAQLDAKVDALNELLTFTKDNADSKTDNSNKLYTQLNEVKKKLNELQKNLDVLK